MAEYRWNQKDAAAGYDAGAPLVHPRYVEVQDAVLAALSARAAPGLIVDAGGGSGHLLERPRRLAAGHVGHDDRRTAAVRTQDSGFRIQGQVNTEPVSDASQMRWGRLPRSAFSEELEQPDSGRGATGGILVRFATAPPSCPQKET